MATFVDFLSGIDDTTGYKAPCRLATTADLGTALTGTPIIDNVQTAAGDRILVWRQTDQTTNGIYVVATGAWSRAIDFTSSSSIRKGTQVFVAEGVSYGGNPFVCQVSNPIIGSTPITFAIYTTAESTAPSRIAVRNVTTGTTDIATPSDGLIQWLSTTTSPKTETIPAASTVPSGQTIRVKDGALTALLYAITITPVSGTVDGQASISINVDGGELELISDGVSNWIVA